MLEIRDNGAVVYDGVAVGEFVKEEARIVLNLGWCRMADLRLTVEGDPKIDRRRIVLSRPSDPKRTEHGDQLSIDDAVKEKDAEA